LAAACAERAIDFHVPPGELCTDNGAMVGACATAMLRRGLSTPPNASPDPNLPLVPSLPH
jgi:tRNA A37 threonylcarbamoyltransferase TsaD